MSINKTDKRSLATWTLIGTECVLPYFQSGIAEGSRQRQPLAAHQDWIETSNFSMMTIRATAPASHAAART
jgi:hypothetical protein